MFTTRRTKWSAFGVKALYTETLIKSRTTSSSRYREGLAAARDAVMNDLQHIPVVSFTDLTSACLPAVSSNLYQSIVASLKKQKLVNADGGWTRFKPGTVKEMREKATFVPLQELAVAIIEAVAQFTGVSSLCNYTDDRNRALFSERTETSCPDAFVHLKVSSLPAGDPMPPPAPTRKGSTPRPPPKAWADVIASIEFKRGENEEDIFDVRGLCVNYDWLRILIFRLIVLFGVRI